MRILAKHIMLVSVVGILFSCSKDDKTQDQVTEPRLIVKIAVDSTQVRLGNTGQPATVGAGNAAQNPIVNGISGHYLELAQGPYTALGAGEVIYHAPETTKGGDNAIDFEQSKIVKPGDVFLEIPLSKITPDTYEWVRLSLSYQNGDVEFRYGGNLYTGTLASFVGFNTYIESYTLKNKSVEVKGNRAQGYWGFETIANVSTGQAPAGATTVPNPLFNTSPIPQGSCVVTGEFASPLVITGNEKEDVVIVMSLSVNKSFEWEDKNGNGFWDVDPGADENVVDMGLRGLIPIIE